MIKPTCWCGGSISYKSVADEHPFQPMCRDSAYHDPFATGRKTSIHRLYIAGPMTGIPDCNYPLFNDVAEMLRLAEYEVINPAEVSAGQRAHYVDYLREDLRAMLDCDGVALLPDWEFSTGARNEVNVAGLLKMPVKTYNDWIVNRQRYQGGQL